MAEYAWTGTTRGGVREQGRVQAESKGAALASLRRRNIRVESLRERGRELSVPRIGAPVSAKELALFTRQLSVMLDAGLPLVQALDILGGQQSNRVLASVLWQVRADLESGSSLAEAMGRHPGVFDDLYRNMIAAGEAGGILDVILRRLALHIEKVVKLRRAVRSALVYPCTVVAIAALVVTVILWKVIPTFEQLFAAMAMPLPLPTRVTIAMSRILGQWMIVIVPGIVLASFGVRSLHGTRGGRRFLDRVALRAPVVGPLLLKVAVARLCRTLGTLVSSGVPILDAMDITARTAGNAVVEDAVLLARRSVEEGKTLAEPLGETAVFPSMVIQMIAVGEQTGALDTMLAKIADFFEEEVDAAVEDLMSLLEPLVILFLGTTIGGIVVSMYLPLFEFIKAM